MEKGISLKDIIETIIKSRRMLFSFFVIAVVMAYFFYWTTPRSYTAEATIFPMAGSNTGVAEFLAGTGLGMLTYAETKANIILVALNSQTLAENVLNKYEIADLILNKPKSGLKPTDLEMAAKSLRAGIVRSFVTKNGSIAISASMRDPDIAAKLVNTYLEELSVFFNEKGINMNFNIIDSARPPLFPSAPNLNKNLTLSMGIAFFFGLVFVGANVGMKR